ncbi:MAG: T9SS type A sorting domain-containing protein [Candidatus Eisenbacteria bacterium]|nr:T9SS type A sorting domain-containing protein [Candidatus Eisenbacteria bacterium]
MIDEVNGRLRFGLRQHGEGDPVRTPGCFVLAAIGLLQSALMAPVQSDETLVLQKTYDFGWRRYSEGLDFYNGFLWHTTPDSLYKLDLESAADIDGDGDYDLQAERTWDLTHSNYSESSVWLGGDLYNFTFLDTLDNLSADIFQLDLHDDGTYQWQHAGVGAGASNWGSCRDKRDPGQFIIYTGHYGNFLFWFDPESGNTVLAVEVGGLDAIEDLGMDLEGTVWASSFDAELYPGLHRIEPDTGEILGSFSGPEGLDVIDGMAIRLVGDHDVIYVTGKNTRFIWEYRILDTTAAGSSGDLVSQGLELRTNRPNPFNSVTRISYFVPEETHVRLSIYNVAGRFVKDLAHGRVGTGVHTVVWDAAETASGVYVCRIQAGDTAIARKMLLKR